MAATPVEQEAIENRFRERIAKILAGYHRATDNGQPNQSPFRYEFNEVASALRDSPTVGNWGKPVKITFGIGRYNKWANVPWIAILNTEVTSSVQRGVFVVYLFREDMTGLYVSLNQGATEAMQAATAAGDTGGRQVALRLKLRARRFAKTVRWIEDYGYEVRGKMSLNSRSATARLYEAGSIAHKFYPANELPPGNILLHELQQALLAYDQIVERPSGSGSLSTSNQWCVYVSHSTAANFVLAEQEGIWGSALAERFAGINQGDSILFVHDMTGVGDPPPRGFPRVRLEQFKGIAARVVKAVVTSPIYEDSQELWPDALYPHRFRFEVEEVSEEAVVDDAEFPLEVLDAIRRSAATGGRPARVQPLGEKDRTEPQEDAAEVTEDDPITPSAESYSLEEALDGLFVDGEALADMLTSFRRKRNLILEGPPGVGKTFVARRLAYLLMGQKDENRIQFLQFHQSYSYEDFVQGWRPKANGGFQLVDGVFLNFCRRARVDSRPHVFVIDEINRGNTSKIFGELFMLLESDKRNPDFAVPLVYSGKADPSFYIPPNVFILGLMNTADRSLAMVDYALRRRFAFGSLQPAFDNPKFVEHLSVRGVSSQLITRIVDRMSALNAQIAADKKNLGPGFRIGHSFFL